MRIKPIIKKIFPEFAIKFYYIFVKWKAVFTWKFRCDRIISKIKDKKTLNVLFLPANLAMWKFDVLFKKMMKHPRFRPQILLSPSMGLDPTELAAERGKMVKYFSEKGFHVVDESDAKKIKPDIVFITQGYGGFAHGLTDFPKALGCYAPYYSFPSSYDSHFVDLLQLNMAWRIFTQNKASYAGTVAGMSNKGKNVRISGYVNADNFFRKDVPFSFPWKLKNPALKKVIYAPHWTVRPDLMLPYSTFLSMGEIMLEIAEKYADKVQWCFKPHPWLLRELEKLPEWGEKRAREYFKRWENLENGTCHNGEYISLFMTSDAMIHDSSSFRYEYFYTKKPVMYLMKEGQNVCDNDVALQAIEAHYHGRCRRDVEKFIEEVVLGGNDPKAVEREHFCKEYLLPPNNKSVAQNIIDEIERGLGWQK
ncbi:MAG: CDP-glycerol glycerophosphotransferase family protein [Opitutae bacterium]|nr:CDP-glycerol glycerophosphotransferase family protein [Opitutae bacterium]